MMMKKKKKQSRSQPFVDKNPKKTLEPSSDSSPSPRLLLSIFRSKLVSGKDLKHMFRGVKSKTVPGLSSQSRIVRCPKCHKLLQEPIDVTTYKCSGCDSILQAKRWELEGNHNSIPEAFLSSQNRRLTTEVKSAEGGSKTPMRTTHREYNLRASPSVERGYHSETFYNHETSDIRREWMRSADEFSRVTGDSDVFASARSSPFNSRSNASEWSQHDGRYENLPRLPFYPASPSPSSVYEYGYCSPFHGSQVSASEQSYNHHHHQPNQFRQYGNEGWFQESSVASPLRFPGETSDGKYNHWSSHSQLKDLQYHNLYESSSSSTTPHRSLYSERSYQAVAAPHRSTYSERSVGISKSEASSERSSIKSKKKYVREKNPVVKRHVLPSVGGAPIATCSYCLELLQLPLVSPSVKQKRYQVRCGSCSGVLKFSFRETVDNVLEDSPSFMDSSTGFAAEETVTIRQDSAPAGHKEISPDESHLSSSDNGSGDGICKNTDPVNLKENPETYEDNRIKEDVKSISSEYFDLKMEALQPQWKPLVTSSETIGETSKIHLEKSEEVHTEKSGDTNIFETHVLSENTRYTQELDWEETRENDEYGSERTWGDKPALHLENSRYIRDFLSDSSSSNSETFEYSTVREDTEHISSTFSEAMSATRQSPVKSSVNENQSFTGHRDQLGEATVTISRSHEDQSKYENENLAERQELDKTTNDRVRYELEDGSTASLEKVSEIFEAIMKGETGEERSVTHQVDSLTENVENSYESLEPLYFEGSSYASERTWAERDRAGLHLEEYEGNYENPNKLFDWTSERAPIFCLHENELGTTLDLEDDLRRSFNDHGNSEERSMFHVSRYDKPEQSQYEYENSSEKQELSQTVPDIVISELQKCRYEANEILEPSNMVGHGSVVSPEKASETNIDESDEERSISRQIAPQYENVENSYTKVEPVYLEGSDGYASERTRAETIGEENQSNPFEWTSETAATLRLHEYEQGKVSSGRSISSSTDSFSDHESAKEIGVVHEGEPWLVNENKTEAIKVGAKAEDGPSLYLEKCENESMKSEDTFEWTSERAPTSRLREYELRTISEPEDGANERSISSEDHEIAKARVVDHEDEPWLVAENKTEALKAGVMADDVPSSHLEKYGSESMEFDETFESRRPLVSCLHEYELGKTHGQNRDANERSISTSTDSFSNHESSKDIPTSHGEEHGPSLHSEKYENESMKSEDAFEWTSERAPTFRLHGYELGTMPEPDEDVDGSSESTSSDSFNKHESSNVRAVFHEEEFQLVNDSRTKALQIGETSEDGSFLHLELEKCENAIELNETFEWTSGRTLTFRLHDYEPETMLEEDEDAGERSEYGSKGSINNHVSSKERAMNHEGKFLPVDDYEHRALEADIISEDEHSLHMEKGDNEKAEFDKALEPGDDRFRLCPEDTLELETNIFHLEPSQDKEDHVKQTFKQGKIGKDTPAEDISSSTMAQADSEAEEESQGDHLEHLQKETEKSGGLTSEPYSHLYVTTEPSEIVGLRLALYETQSSPLRSPLTSPIHTPIGSPLHYLMNSQMRSPITSPINSHIVSPLRSPINSSGSLSDVLFFDKKV